MTEECNCDQSIELKERLKSAEDALNEIRRHDNFGINGTIDAHFEKYEPKDTLREIWGDIYERIVPETGDLPVWIPSFEQIQPLITEAKKQGAIEVLEKVVNGGPNRVMDIRATNELEKLKENK